MIIFDHLFAAAARGTGSALLVSGAGGSGKTALLQTMAAQAGSRGGWCFLATASASERGHPFGVFDRLIRSLHAAGMTHPCPGGLDEGEGFFAAMDRVCAVIRDFATKRPIVIGVDDIHFADEPSLRCLTYLIRRIESCGVVMVLDESSSYERDTASLRVEMLHLPFCHRLRLPPLSPASVVAQIRSRFGGVPDSAFARYCLEVSGGVPLLLHALIDDRAALPGPLGGEPGASFRQAVLRSLHRCAPATTAVAQALAVLGDHADPALAAELSGRDAALVLEGMRDLGEMGLLDGRQFRHPETRAAVLASIPPPELPAMHARAAGLLHENGAPANAVAGHLIAAQDGGRAAWRVTILGEAAREAMAAGDVEDAVNNLRHAVAACSGEAERAQTALLVAEAQWLSDPGRAARRLDGLTTDARSGLLPVADILVVANHLLWWGEFGEADEMLRLAGAATGEDSAAAQLWAFFCRSDPRSGICAEPGRPADSPLAHSGVMAAVTAVTSAASLPHDGPAVGTALQMLLGLRGGAEFTPALHDLVVLVQTGRLEEALVWCDRLLAEDWIDRVPMRRAMIATIKAVAACRDGDPATALACVREVLGVIPPHAWGIVAGLPLSIAVCAATDLGDVELARSLLAVPVPPAMFDTPFALPYLQALGRYHLAMGRPESALVHARSGTELLEKWGVAAAGIAAAARWYDQADALCWFSAARPDRPGRHRHGHRPEPMALPAADAEDDARLTDAEQRVATLAAVGNTNRQIAASLFITVSTVEQHLTKIYRKLKVRNRSGLRRRDYRTVL
ncbi:ATP-binding protein [Actinoplanes rectilineatus]|uniref:ATP-binding protein n=1 Tax=Actinoplanes rectilineatus TaxID=113571 RepID=UPI0005F2B62C|nr:helix-turn-helix transcriptional regulator [Actinoplanes rectilineatus]